MILRFFPRFHLFSHFINPNLEPMEAFYVLVALG